MRKFAWLVLASALLWGCGPRDDRDRDPSLAEVMEGPQGALPQRLAGVRNWVYVLQGSRGSAIDPRLVAAAGYDLTVTDHSATGDAEGIFPASAVRTMQRGGKSIVLAYVSIGEAEDYRFYWRRPWTRGERPSFIGPSNRQWKGNFWVRYWDEAWREVLFGRPGSGGSYVDRVIAAGFDGVYLDKVDAYEEAPAWERRKGIDPRAEMIRLVCDLSAYARQVRPGFLVFVQNAPELVEEPSVLRAVDGIGQEETWVAATNRVRPAGESARVEGLLSAFRKAGKLVLTVDYGTGDRALRARERSRELGFVPFVTDVNLTRTPPVAP